MNFDWEISRIDYYVEEKELIRNPYNQFPHPVQNAKWEMETIKMAHKAKQDKHKAKKLAHCQQIHGRNSTKPSQKHAPHWKSSCFFVLLLYIHPSGHLVPK